MLLSLFLLLNIVLTSRSPKQLSFLRQDRIQKPLQSLSLLPNGTFFSNFLFGGYDDDKELQIFFI